jgi:hypothetical protein
MTIFDLVTQHLTQNGFDGLYNSWCDCACKIGDIAPCQGIQPDCKPGYRIVFKDGDWGMGPDKLQQDGTP